MKFYVVDAFADKPFSGNPAAVCILDQSIPDDLMQKIAGEFNLSETAFLFKQENKFNLRWFTPTTEVDLCGHATLASAHVLWEIGLLDVSEEAVFATKSGILNCTKDNNLIFMEFPREEVRKIDSVPKELLLGLRVKTVFEGKNRLDYFIEVKSEEVLRKLQPDFRLIAGLNSRGVIVTSASDSDKCDFVSRFFAPRSGINEDPVTGSAHCALGPYWSDKLGREKLIGFQASKRGGVVNIIVKEKIVILGGSAVTVVNGELFI